MAYGFESYNDSNRLQIDTSKKVLSRVAVIQSAAMPAFPTWAPYAVVSNGWTFYPGPSPNWAMAQYRLDFSLFDPYFVTASITDGSSIASNTILYYRRTSNGAPASTMYTYVPITSSGAGGIGYTASPGAVITYYLYNTTYNVPTSNYGIVLYDESSNIIFTSDFYPPKIRGITAYTLNTSNMDSFGTQISETILPTNRTKLVDLSDLGAYRSNGPSGTPHLYIAARFDSDRIRIGTISINFYTVYASSITYRKIKTRVVPQLISI